MTLFGFWIDNFYTSLSIGINFGIGVFYQDSKTMLGFFMGSVCLSIKYYKDDE